MSIRDDTIRFTMNPYQTVDNREKGHIPVSKGTALAIAAAQGVYPGQPAVNPAPIAKVELIMINLRTLYRNLLASMRAETKAFLKPDHLVGPLLEELHILNSAIADSANGRCRTLFYISQYEHINERKFPGALFRKPKSTIQLAAALQELDTFTKLFTKSVPDNIIHYPGQITGKFPSTLLLSHYVVDLLDRYSFKELQLLESNTGKIKPPVTWGTKLSGVTVEYIPLNAFTLKVFGDSSSFSGQRPKLRNAVMQIALDDNWTGLTTEDLIRNSISKISDAELRSELRALM